MESSAIAVGMVVEDPTPGYHVNQFFAIASAKKKK
jgi:hypothetical protein